jgi:gamma-glutamyltranspeptidase/glutathione hydrolase
MRSAASWRSLRDFQTPGRSPVQALNAMIATPHPLASAAGLEALQSGGNAVDAAVTAVAVLAVVDLAQVGLGGDAFALFSPKGGSKIIALDGAGAAPAAATAFWYRDRGHSVMPNSGAHSVIVPGAVKTWARLAADHGTRSFAELLQPAIKIAEQGFPVTARVAMDWRASADRLAQDEATASVFLPGGRPPLAGEIFRNPGLAKSLRSIAAGGPDALYEGWIAEDLVATLRKRGGLHAAEDFAGYRCRYVDPIQGDYRGATIVQCPPSGQGLTALIILKILAEFNAPTGEPIDAARFHLLSEASKLAYAERDAWIGDPLHSDIPVERLLSDAHIQALAARIDPENALSPPAPPLAGDTVYVSVVDRDRNVVSLISSIFRDFGSGVTGEKSGILLHSRGSGFVLQDGHPNCLAPGKRPLHTIMPGMALDRGRPMLSFGVVGGHFQPAGQALLLTGMLDYGLDPQSAIDLPRAFATEGVVKVERGIPDFVRTDLARRGHKLVESPTPLGGAQAIHIDWTSGVLTGASDGRLDGCALGL